jgi:ATP-dependent RNA helicase MRH4
MDLSARVAQGPKNTTPDGKPVRKSRNSPFNGMNITTPPRDLQIKAARHVSAAEEKRVMRHVKGGRGKPVKEKEPMKALKMQRALASVPYERRARTKIELAERDHFDEFDLLPEIKESVPMQALDGLEDIAPTPIQRLAIPALLGTEDGRRRKKGKDATAPPTKKEMQQFLLAAETGSGKTLAYVLPVVDALKRAEAFEAQQEAEAAEQEKQIQRSGQGFELPSPEVDDPHHTTGRPRVIILVPTQELVAQVGALVKSLSHTVKFRAAMISANYSSTIIRNRLFSPQGIDVVVSTPHLLNSITESDPNVLSRVSHLVIDEADSLLDRSFSPLTSSIIDRATPSLQQLILCSATIPRSLDTYLHKRYPSIRRLTTPNLHAIPRRVQLTVVDIDKIPYQGNRDLTCAQVIWDLGKQTKSPATCRAKASTPRRFRETPATAMPAPLSPLSPALRLRRSSRSSRRKTPNLPQTPLLVACAASKSWSQQISPRVVSIRPPSRPSFCTPFRTLRSISSTAWDVWVAWAGEVAASCLSDAVTGRTLSGK